MNKVANTKTVKYQGKEIPWLSDEEYKEAKFQLESQLENVFKVFNMYGLGQAITPAIGEVLRLCEDFALRVRGIDKEISLKIIREEEGVTSGLEYQMIPRDDP